MRSAPTVFRDTPWTKFEPLELIEPVQPSKTQVDLSKDLGRTDASHILAAYERAIRENERLRIERDQLRDEISRRGLMAWQAHNTKPEPKKKERDECVPSPEQNAEEPDAADADRTATPDSEVAKPVAVTGEVAEENLAAAVSAESVTSAQRADCIFEHVAHTLAGWLWKNPLDPQIALVRDGLSAKGLDTMLEEAVEAGDSDRELP